MLRVHVLQHKDGDHLTISKVPWWTPIYEWMLDRLCPCCGITSFLFEKLPESLHYKYYHFWSDLMFWQDRFEKELYRTPIENGCRAAYRIWNRSKDMCWHDENCLEKE